VAVVQVANTLTALQEPLTHGPTAVRVSHRDAALPILLACARSSSLDCAHWLVRTRPREGRFVGRWQS
jgi:hypothetical protein